MKPINQICQLEIGSWDLAGSLDFYEVVFGWKKAMCDIHEYTVLDVGKDCPYGISLVPMVKTDQRKTWATLTVYFATHCPEILLEKAVAAGGKMAGNSRSVPGYGRVCFVQEPGGQRFGLFTANR